MIITTRPWAQDDATAFDVFAQTSRADEFEQCGGFPAAAETAADELARSLGYTRRVYVEGGCEGGEFLIQPSTDLDDRFRAWGVDWQEWSLITGSNCTIEDVDA